MIRDAFDDGLPPRPVPAPWTSSRCNRTLRKLTTFVAKLEKWHQAFLVASEKEVVEEEDDSQTEHQLSWLAQDTAKRDGKSKKTYTGRRKVNPQTPTSKCSRKSRAVGATPHDNKLHRIAMKIGDVEKPNVHKNIKINAGQDITRPPSISHSWTAATAHLEDEYDAIIRDGWIIIPSFLVVTADPDLPSHFDHDSECCLPEKGARTLTNMCLGSLSRNIVERQKQNDTMSARYDRQNDIVGSQLQELEDYFGDYKNGWRPLRRVVRTCGISLVARLIRNGAIFEKQAIELGTRWNHRPYLDDFSEAVQEALLDSSFQPVATDTGYHYLPGMEELEQCDGRLRDPWKSELVHRWTLQALRNSQDPIAVLASGIRFNHLTLSIAFSRQFKVRRDSGNEILEAIYQAALSCSQCHTHQDLRHAVASISPVVHDQHQATARTDLDERLWQRLKMASHMMLWYPDDSNALPELIKCLYKRVQILIELGLDQHLSNLQQMLTAQVLFVHLCHVLIEDCKVPDDLLRSFESLLCSMEARPTLAKQLAGTIISCRGDTFEGFRRLAEQILSIKFDGFENLHILLMQIVSDAAMEYAAEYSKNPATLPWATEIHEKTRESLAILIAHYHASSNETSKTGYRWDDGIEEWIAKTPAMVHTADGIRSTSTAHLSRRDSDDSKSDVPGTKETLRRTTADCASPTASRGQHRVNGAKRKQVPGDFEIYTDGDFEYKKPRRKTLPKQGSTSACAVEAATLKGGSQDRENRGFEDISGDELSLVE